MKSFREDVNEAMMKASEQVNDPHDNKNGFIPHLILTGKFNHETLFNKLTELNEYVKVDFDENGEIPDYIEFDRNDKDKYSTIEEVLTMFVNYNLDDIKENDDELILKFPPYMFKEYVGELNIEYMCKQSVTDTEIVKVLQDYDEYLAATKEVYLEYLDAGKSLEDINNIHLMRVANIEDMSLKIKCRIKYLFERSILKFFDNSMKYVIDNHEYRLRICNDSVTFMNKSFDYVHRFVDGKTSQIKDIIMGEYHKIKVLHDIDNLL